jgi:hypothetical protein
MRNATTDSFGGLAAGGVLLSAVVHLDLWDVERFRLIHTIGPLFLTRRKSARRVLGATARVPARV